MLKGFTFIFLFFYSFFLSGNDINSVKIGLFYQEQIQFANIKVQHSVYQIIIDDEELTIFPDDEVQLIGEKNGFTMAFRGNVKNNIKMLRLVAVQPQGTFTLQVNTANNIESRTYYNDLIIQSKESSLKFINEVNINHYLCGVIGTEVGNSGNKTLYEVKTYLCRTFLYSQFDKHASEGFNLCDCVHCQAYKGTQYNATIAEVVNKTLDAVITDKSFHVVTPVYSANCGGQTCNSEDVWSSKDPHLRSTKCSHCKDSKGSQWETSIPLKQWQLYMKQNNIVVKDVKSYDFEPNGRRKYYKVGKRQLPLTKIRKDLGLRSTYFTVKVSGNEVILKGLGYGHGVGLCQEGAIQMASEGYSAEEILNYYYKNITIVPTPQAQPPQNIMYRNNKVVSEIFNPWK